MKIVKPKKIAIQISIEKEYPVEKWKMGENKHEEEWGDF